jgi:hypothetical protein
VQLFGWQFLCCDTRDESWGVRRSEVCDGADGKKRKETPEGEGFQLEGE